MASNLDKSLDDIVQEYGPKRTDASTESPRSVPYIPKSNSTQVYVGNLPYSFKWHNLKDMCKEYGFVKRADVVEVAGRSKGYGIVVFNSTEDAEKCVEGLDRKIVDGRNLNVKIDDKPEVTARLLKEGKEEPFSNGKHVSRRSGASKSQVFVGNLPYSTQWQELKDLCKPFGNVTRADIVEDGGRSRGFGIVAFDSIDSAEACISGLNGSTFERRQLKVEFDRGRPTTSGIGRMRRNAGSGGMKIGSHHLTAPGMGSMKIGSHRITLPGLGMHNLVKPGMGGMQIAIPRHHVDVGGTSSVFIGNLSRGFSWQNLKDLCRPFGNVVYADVEAEEGRSRSCGIVKFSAPHSAQMCVAGLSGRFIDGHDLIVYLDKFGGIPKQGRTRVFVGNLPWSFKRWQDLKDLCRNFGEVTRADIEESEDGRSKGYGFVTFSTLQDAQNCIAHLHGQIMEGRDLNVQFDRGERK